MAMVIEAGVRRAPFDVITVAAAPKKVPQPLIDQLAPGGKLVVPIGVDSQQLLLVEKDSQQHVTRTTMAAVRFVPMTSELR